jgi:OOP family OmpA-OmpF porin
MDVTRSFAVAAAFTLLAACGFGDSVVQERVDGVLAHPDNNLAWVSGSISRGALTLTGTAPSDEAKAGAVSLVRQIPGVESVVDHTALDTAFVRKRDETEACEVGIVAALEDGQIEFSGTTLRSRSRAALDRVAVVLEGCPDTSVEVAGHTDSSGSEAANLRVSEQRAGAAIDYLVGKGLEAARFTVVGHGESQPIGDNGTAVGRAANRRVEFHLTF